MIILFAISMILLLAGWIAVSYPDKKELAHGLIMLSIIFGGLFFIAYLIHP